MLTEHDNDLMLRCPQLGQEINFGFCRRESRGKPCHLIIECWREQFDVRAFLQAHFSEEDMARLVRMGDSSRPPRQDG